MRGRLFEPPLQERSQKITASYVFSNKARSKVYFLSYRDFLDDIRVMNAKAAPQAGLKSKFGLGVALVVVGLMSALFASSALAAPITKGGQVHACYRVKGKAKGAMRVVPAKKKCRRGEKKLAWSVAGPAGPAGQNGVAGANGANGSNGTQGTAGEAALQAKVAGLTVKVEGLEGLLAGVTTGQLSGTVAKLNGITGLQLTETVKQLPVVSYLCTQASSVPTQVNSSLGNVLSGLSLGGTIPALLSLNVPVLTPITSYTCPS
jgi:hypothetical protein